MATLEDEKIIGTATRLKGNGRFGWYALALVSTTRLQPSAVQESALKMYHLEEARLRQIIFDDFNVSGTVLPLSRFDLAAVSEPSADQEDYNAFLEDDFVISPIYVNEFKIKVGSFKIDKSLPKIFID